MNVFIRQIKDKQNEKVIIDCVEITQDVQKIRSFVLTKGTTLTGKMDESICQFNLNEVYYFEAVDEKVFAYTEGKVYELRNRLYELESAYSDKHFVRCSKSFLINLMKLESISPSLNGRFVAHMKNGEKIVVSRRYVLELKRIIIGGEVK